MVFHRLSFAALLLIAVGTLVYRIGTGRFRDFQLRVRTAAESPMLFAFAILVNLWAIGVLAIGLWSSFNTHSR